MKIDVGNGAADTLVIDGVLFRGGGLGVGAGTDLPDNGSAAPNVAPGAVKEDSFKGVPP